MIGEDGKSTCVWSGRRVYMCLVRSGVHMIGGDGTCVRRGGDIHVFGEDVGRVYRVLGNGLQGCTCVW